MKTIRCQLQRAWVVAAVLLLACNGCVTKESPDAPGAQTAGPGQDDATRPAVTDSPTLESSLPPLLPTLQPRPEFILGVSPEEGVVIPLDVYEYIGAERPMGLHSQESGYETMVCVDFSLHTLVQRGDDLSEAESVQERVELFVDGMPMGKVVSGIVWGPLGEAGPQNKPDTFWSERQAYCWYVPLAAGTHRARFKFHQTSGDVQEYLWQFALTG